MLKVITTEVTVNSASFQGAYLLPTSQKARLKVVYKRWLFFQWKVAKYLFFRHIISDIEKVFPNEYEFTYTRIK